MSASTPTFSPIEPLRRGHVVWIRVTGTVGSEQKDLRPWLVVSNNMVKVHLPIIIGVPLTHKVEKAKGHPYRILLKGSLFTVHWTDAEHQHQWEGESLALCEQVRVLSLERIKEERQCTLSGSGLNLVEAGLAYAQGLPP